MNWFGQLRRCWQKLGSDAVSPEAKTCALSLAGEAVCSATEQDVPAFFQQSLQRWRSLSRSLQVLVRTPPMNSESARVQVRQISEVLGHMETVLDQLTAARADQWLDTDTHDAMLSDLMRCEQHLRFLKTLMDELERRPRQLAESALRHTRQLWASLHALLEGEVQREDHEQRERYLRQAVAAQAFAAQGEPSGDTSRSAGRVAQSMTMLES
ncbi:hypothetical protein ACKC9G_16135 [Pokkaliibacter sp. CJK22405]|uniref:hypothetical protein n=1 Tax=Pokkaliibacter sp. CJK22405 TaxID=3384615 RepID=UPI003984DC20